MINKKKPPGEDAMKRKRLDSQQNNVLSSHPVPNKDRLTQKYKTLSKNMPPFPNTHGIDEQRLFKENPNQKAFDRPTLGEAPFSRDSTGERESENLAFKLLEAKYIELVQKNGKRKIISLAQQLSPIMDRLGRTLVDLSPHVAMMGADITSLMSMQHWVNVSANSQNGSPQPINCLGLFERFSNAPLNLPAFQSPGDSHPPSQIISPQQQQNRLTSESPIYF